MADYKLNILIDQLRYQIVTPRVTTMGHCANEKCSIPARGARECRWCVLQQIIALLGDDRDKAFQLEDALMHYCDAWWASEEAIETLLESNRD